MAISFPYRIDALGRTSTPSGAASHARELLEQFLFTSPGERVMRPGFGGAVQQLVFAPADDQAAAAAQHLIGGGIQQWLSTWIELQSVDVRGDDATMAITVRYRLRATGADEVAEFQVAR
jgi:phage baseplate assembly protein W